MKRQFRLINQEVRQRCIEAIKDAPDGHVIEMKEPTRSTDSNAAMWRILQKFSEQLQWPVNGQMVHMSAESWKDVLSAAFRKETTQLAMGLEGGVVMLGSKTSKFTVREMSDFIEFASAVAVQRGVDIS